MKTQKGNFTIECARLNTTGQYFAKVSQAQRKVTTDELMAVVRTTLSMDRSQGKLLEDTLRDYVIGEIAMGNAVELFGLATVAPEMKLKKSRYGTEAEVMMEIERIDQRDVTVGVKACAARKLLEEVRRVLSLK